MLYLTSLKAGFKDRVFAHWYTGQLRIPDGEQIEYMHMGFGSQYERDILVTVRQVSWKRYRLKALNRLPTSHAAAPGKLKIIAA